MEDKKMTTDVLKARIEVMKNSKNLFVKRIALMMEQKLNSMKSEE